MRSKSWKKVWFIKSFLECSEKQPLHAMVGFDMLTRKQWDKVIYFFIDKLEIKGRESVLEIGCGSGAFLDAVKRRYKKIEITGFDNCSNYIDVAKQKLIGRFFVQDASDNEWDLDDTFDIITSFSVFQYLDSLYIATQVMENMFKHLKKEGKVFIGDIPNKIFEDDDKEYRRKEKKYLLRSPELNADHLYYDKDFFITYVRDKGKRILILDHENVINPIFPNIKYRYSLVIS